MTPLQRIIAGTTAEQLATMLYEALGAEHGRQQAEATAIALLKKTTRDDLLKSYLERSED